MVVELNDGKGDRVCRNYAWHIISICYERSHWYYNVNICIVVPFLGG